MPSTDKTQKSERAVRLPSEPSALLKYLYTAPSGRRVLRAISGRGVSAVAGAFMSSRFSRAAIKPFIRSNSIDMTDFEEREFNSFNDFFTRRVKDGTRPIDVEPSALVAPCDANLAVYPVTETAQFAIKHTRFSTASLLANEKAARRFAGGYALVFRLAVDNYHRVCFFDNAEKSRSRFVAGELHTVQAIACENGYDIFARNCRSVSYLRTENFGGAAMVWVGALMVGRIVEARPERCAVKRGEEAGYFEFGGSTVVLLLQKDRAEIDPDILAASARGLETCVKYGERIGNKPGV